eukprot:TRINITY_DN7487_c0_g1_i1.p1 TRINITY_DN7487_c0_g1~~TRINITY_DN7487_c0_g1_i1.p1  ORF type:complete len:115 (+),score=29.07 TRINITY_DN7487_c0_g1_i1:3-347(+)
MTEGHLSPVVSLKMYDDKEENLELSDHSYIVPSKIRHFTSEVRVSGSYDREILNPEVVPTLDAMIESDKQFKQFKNEEGLSNDTIPEFRFPQEPDSVALPEIRNVLGDFFPGEE